MSIRRWDVASAAVCVASTLAVGPIRAASQISTGPDVLGSLLTEVHQLRLAVERSTSIAPRVQLTLARLNIQEQRTVALGRDLDQIRQQLSAASLEKKRLSSNLEDVQKDLQVFNNPSERASAEARQQLIKGLLAQQAIVEDRLRVREADAMQLLSAEQLRWADLNSKLDELERLLGPAR
jgi:hypothetical protein